MKKNKQMSKTMIKLDYWIAAGMVIFFALSLIFNYVYGMVMTNKLISNGSPEYISSIILPIDLSQIAIIITAWFAQLGISSTAYYFMCKSDHAIEIPAKMIGELPPEIIEKINDPTEIIVSAITTK